MTIKMGRRQLLFCMLSAPFMAACDASGDAEFAHLEDHVELQKITEAILNLPELDAPYTDNVEFDVFYRLCQLILGQVDLNQEVAQKIYRLNNKEQWGRFHAASIYQLITDRYYDSEKAETLPLLVQKGLFKEAEEWYLTHLLTTWHLGIYYHDDTPEPIRVSFSSSLMWQAVEGVIPVPGMSNFEPQYWAKAPLKISESINNG